MHEAKAQLSKLTRIQRSSGKPGLFEDQIVFIAPDAFDAVSDQEIDSWLEK